AQTVARLSVAKAGKFPGSRRSALPGLQLAHGANRSPAERSESREISRVAAFRLTRATARSRCKP
ncbi:hypothetical protein ACU625_23840, partial [Klebsiella aerogenes]